MRAIWIPAAVLSVMLELGLCRAKERDDLPAVEPAQKLVRAGLRAELLNRPEERYELLRQALVDFPDDGPANWHAGRVRLGDAWLQVETAEARAAADGRVAEYRRLRGELAATLDGQAALARWCRKQQMRQVEELHWATVLQFAPIHEEARKRMGVKEFRGRLLTLEQIAEYKKQVDEFEAANAKWQPVAEGWKSAILRSDQEKREVALRELRAVRDPAAIPAMEEVLSSASDQLALEVVAVLQQLPGQQAANSLVRHAVFADAPHVRIAAAEGLRSRSMFAYVPLLLANLKAPIELSYYADSWDAGSGVAFYTLQEGPDRFIERHDQYTVFSVMLSERRIPIASGTLRAVMKRAAQARAVTVSNSAASANLESEALNERIYPALRITTGQEFPDQPREWWQWWQQYNELQASREGDKPTQRLYGHRIQTCSCFLPGTQVWTDTGTVSIEKVRPGDRVLSQNQDTGELTYKLVIDTTIRPSSPTVRISLDGEEIAATLGHPIWVVGKGWRMAKEIEAGDYLHGLRGGVPVRYIENGPDSQAYNLVVAEFNSYFIGLNRILVHDNVARTPTEALLPGFQP